MTMCVTGRSLGRALPKICWRLAWKYPSERKMWKSGDGFVRKTCSSYAIYKGEETEERSEGTLNDNHVLEQNRAVGFAA